MADRADRAVALANKMRNDEGLLASGRVLGITPEDLMPRRGPDAFRTSPDDPDDVLNMRFAHHERLRQELARELVRHHEKLSSGERRMRRAASADSLSRVASASSTSTLKIQEDDRRLLTNLKKRREAIPDAFFERSYAKAAVKEARATERHLGWLEMQRRGRHRIVENQERARERVEERRREEALKDEVGRHALEERLAQAASRKEADQREVALGIERAKQHSSQRTLQLSRSLASLDQSEADRVARLHRRMNLQEAHVEETMRKKQYEAALRAERSRMMQQDRQGRREREMVSRMVQNEMVRDKHAQIDERLKLLGEHKAEMMRQRRISSIRSTLERQAIIVNSKGEWKDRLRWQPLPETPDEILATMGL